MTQPNTYEVLFQLARGGMGTIELARSIGGFGVERLVAIKRIHAHLSDSSEAVARFLAEARVVAQVHHANVVGLHHAGQDQQGYFAVFDYVEGETLEGLVGLATLRRDGLPAPVVIRILLDGLAGLHAAHEAKDASGKHLGILHRDVSLQNLLVGRDGVTRLSDFGIAKSSLHTVNTDVKYIAGKLVYMPPEYLRRQPVDRRMDIYAIGVTMLSALAGGEPWRELGEAQLFSLIMSEGVPRLSALGVSVAPEIEDIVARACHSDPAQRYATAREMTDALEQLGRRTGWIASHLEVAECVETLAGSFLDDRRDTIALKVASPGHGPVLTLPPPHLPWPLAPTAAEHGTSSTGEQELVTGRSKIPSRVTKAFILGALASTIAGGIVVARRDDAPRNPSADEPSVPASGVPVLVPPPVRASASEGAEPAPAEPAAIPTAPAPIPSATVPSSGTARTGSRAVTRPSSRPMGERSAPAVPNQISTANPYR